MNYKEIEIDWMKEILRDKEEEIKKLKSDLSLVIKERDNNIKQNKKLREERDFFKEQAILWRKDYKNEYEQNSYRKKIVDIIPQDEKSIAEETIQDLQERIRFLEQCLDNKEKVNKSLREELQRYKDMWDSWEF